MFLIKVRTRLLLILGILGMVIALAAGLAEHVGWLASLCGGLFSGCTETARFTFLKVPIWILGVAYYAVLIALLFFGRRLVPAWVAAGFGVEITLMWIMFSMEVSCIFCLINFAVVLFILIASFEKSLFWQTLAMSSMVCLLAALVIPLENQSIASTSKEGPAVVARVKGHTITENELIFPIATELHKLEQQIYRKKKNRLDQLIAEVLLEDEASRRGITVQQLVNEMIQPNDLEVSDEEIERHFDENRSDWVNWRGPIDQLRARVRASAVHEKYLQKVAELSRSFAGEDELTISLQEPELPLMEVSSDGDPSWGPSDAPVTVYEFSDYECPICRNTHNTIKTVKETFAGKVRWVFKDFPLRMHRWARKAAEASQCAGEQGKFWEYHDALFGSDRELNMDQLKLLAKQTGLNTDLFDICLESGRFDGEIARAIETARKAGINATPTFVINGRYHPGAPSLEEFKALIDRELTRIAASK